MKKKIISAILAASMLAGVSMMSAYAETTYTKFKVLGKDSIKNGFVKYYTYNKDSNCNSGIYFKNLSTGTKTSVFEFKNALTSPVTERKNTDVVYEGNTYISEKYSTFGGNINTYFDFSKTGGTYEKIRIKLSDFSDYFNTNGTHSKMLYGTEHMHDYTFNPEIIGADKYYSSLIFISGAAIACVAPDSNGYVEFYASKNIGTSISFVTDFGVVTGNSSLTGGGTTGSPIYTLISGNVDLNSRVDIDDVTEIQKYLASLNELSTLSKRNSDVDLDNKITIDDATEIQKYLAK